MQLIRFAIVAATLAWAHMATAQASQDVRAYIFGNSLINHVSDAPHTNVPHWVNALAKADGNRFALDGQFGFLRDFARMLPPTANWGFRGVSGVWNPDSTNFRAAPFSDIILNPANFIQYQDPDAPFDGENDGGETPLSATLRVMDWVTAQGLTPRFHIYEGWAEMAGIAARFPPTDAEFAAWHAFNQGAYHDWYVTYVDALRAARPELDIRLIPVASVLAELLGTPPLSIIPATDLYSDDAPHGTETLYFMAALVSYAALYDTAPPADFDVPSKLHPVVAAQYQQIAQMIPDMLPPLPVRQAQQSSPAPAVIATPEPTPTQPQGAPPPPLPSAEVFAGQGISDIPALGMGLNGLADWSTQHPFIDLMKTSREWIGHLPGQWGGFSTTQMRDGRHLDDNGWPLRLPPEVERIEALLLTDQPQEADHLRGSYRLYYDGTGDLELTGRAKRVRASPGNIRFQYDPGDGLVGLSISAIDPDDPIRNIRVMREDHIPLYQAGALFNPDWIDRIKDVRSVRFMDWMFTNGSPLSSWDSRPRMSDYTWTSYGVPIPVMVKLANTIGADPWFTLPHMADDTYVRNFAEQVRDTLDPRLKAYVEYSNEVWNFIFPQAHWAAAQAEARWGGSESGWMQFYGLRAAQVMDIWSDVYGAEAADRLVRVVATHTGWPGLEENILIAPLALLELGKPPRDSFDAYAVTGYFGYELGGEEISADVQSWLDSAEAAATTKGQAEGLQRVALREYVRKNRFDAAYAPVTDALLDGSLRELVQEVLPYHAAIASDNDLRLVMYEGGTHVTAHGPRVDDERLTDFFAAYNYSDDMAGLYEVLLAGWVQSGGTLFNAFVDVAPASQWGSWGALRHLSDDNPRWSVLNDYNATAPNNWETRDPEAFTDGIFRLASGRIQGTQAEDILIGSDRADTLVSQGGEDHLNGQGGNDVAQLRGASDAYEFTRDGDLLIADGPYGRVHLYDIERLVFDASPGVELRTADL